MFSKFSKVGFSVCLLSKEVLLCIKRKESAQGTGIPIPKEKTTKILDYPIDEEVVLGDAR